MKTVSKQSLSAVAASLLLASGFVMSSAFAQAPARGEPLPFPPVQRDAPAPQPMQQQGQSSPQSQPQQAGADTQGYLNTEAMKEVCKEKFPKSADKIEANWKKAAAESPPAMKQQTNSKEYKAELGNKVKELKSVDVAQLQPSCENMAR